MKRFLPCLLALLCAGRLTAQSPEDFLANFTKNFARWDLDHDGILSPKELDAAVVDPQTKNENAATVAALKRASRLTKTPLAPFTLENVTTMTQGRQPD